MAQPTTRTAGGLLGVALVALLIAFGVGTARVSGVHAVSYDGAISYLAATAHQGEYAQKKVATYRWVPAAEWQSLWSPAEFWAFRAIGEDLARNDIHPPLYFWVLHVWIHAFGTAPTSGLYLNLLLMVVAAASVFAACRSYRCSVPVATAAVALWALSEATLWVLDEARPYMLLALISATFLWGLNSFLRRRTWQTSAALGAIALIGFLTHYHFALVIASAAAVTLVAFASKRDWAAILKAVVAATVAAATFLLIHPLFYLAFLQQREQAEPLSVAEVPLRISKTISEASGLVLPKTAAWWVTFHVVELVLLLLAALLLVVAVPRFRQRMSCFTGKIGQSVRQTVGSTNAHVPVTMFALTFGAISLLYLLFLSPRHAMGPKYMAIASPFLFVAIGQVLQLGYERVKTLNGPRRLLLMGVVCTLLGMQAIAAVLIAPNERSSPTHLASWEGHPIIIDDLRRGVLPPLLWRLPPETYVFAGVSGILCTRSSLTDLLSHPDYHGHPTRSRRRAARSRR